MREIIINKNEAGQRFDKLLFKYFNAAPASFVYKMLRKKNITSLIFHIVKTPF